MLTCPNSQRTHGSCWRPVRPLNLSAICLSLRCLRGGALGRSVGLTINRAARVIHQRGIAYHCISAGVQPARRRSLALAALRSHFLPSPLDRRRQRRVLVGAIRFFANRCWFVDTKSGPIEELLKPRDQASLMSTVGFATCCRLHDTTARANSLYKSNSPSWHEP